MCDIYGEKLNFVHANSYETGHGPGFSVSGILQKQKPQLLIVPADIPSTGNHAQNLLKYGKCSPCNVGANTTVWYDPDQINVLNMSNDLPTGNFPGVEYNQIGCFEVQMFYKKARTPNREFVLLTWNYKMMKSSDMDPVKRMQGIVAFSQQLACNRRKPVMVTGDFGNSNNFVEKLVKFMNGEIQTEVLNGLKEAVDPSIFLPSMVDGATREVRWMMKLNVHRISDCQLFLASKELSFGKPEELFRENEGIVPSPTPVIGPEVPPHMAQKQKTTPTTQSTNRPFSTPVQMRPQASRQHGG